MDWFAFFAKKNNTFGTLASNVNESKKQKFHRSEIFYQSGFSKADTADSQGSRGRKNTILIPLYQFHTPTNFQTLICSFASEMNLFNRSKCNS